MREREKKERKRERERERESRLNNLVGVRVLVFKAIILTAVAVTANIIYYDLLSRNWFALKSSRSSDNGS